MSHAFKGPLKFILPAAALALPFIGEALGPALFGAEAGAGAAGAAGGLGEAAGAGGALAGGADEALSAGTFFLPGTDTAIAGGIPSAISFPGEAAAGASSFLLPGTDTPIAGGTAVPGGITFPGEAAAGAGGLSGGLGAAPQLATSGISDVPSGIAGGAAPTSVGGAAPLATSPIAPGGAPVGQATGAVSGGAAGAPAAPASVPLSPSSSGLLSAGAQDQLSSSLLGQGDTGGSQFLLPGTDTPIAGGRAVPGGIFPGGGAATGATQTTTPTALLGEGATSGSAPATPAASSGTSGVSAFRGGLDKALGNVGLNTSDLGPIASIGGLGLNLLRSGQQLPGQAQINQGAAGLQSSAASSIAQGQRLQSYLNTGTLPPGVQGGIDSAREAAKSTLRSRYAASGESGSSAEAEDLAHVDTVAATQGADVALQLLQTGVGQVAQGVSQEGLSSQLYQYIMEQALQRDQQLGSAIGNFASSLVPAPTIRLAA